MLGQSNLGVSPRLKFMEGVTVSAGGHFANYLCAEPINVEKNILRSSLNDGVWWRKVKRLSTWLPELLRAAFWSAP